MSLNLIDTNYTFSMCKDRINEIIDIVNTAIEDNSFIPFFKIISNGVDTIEATQSNDTLNILAGDNIELVYDNTTKTITINSTGGGDVSISGTPSLNQIAIWDDSDTIKGLSFLTYIDSTYSGLQLQDTTKDVKIILDSPDTFRSFLNFQNGSVISWEIGKGTSNNFVISRYDSTGAYIDTPFKILNSDGIVYINTLSVTNTISEGGTLLSAKYAPIIHTHDDRYYTKNELTDSSTYLSLDYLMVHDAGLRRCSIDISTGAITLDTGIDLMVNTTNDDSPDGQFYALKVWNAVFNDIADWQKLDKNEPIIYGKCYYQNENGLKLVRKDMQKGVMGIASDTFGLSVGKKQNEHQVPLAISGFVLAYVDGYVEIGDALTCNRNGNLRRMDDDEKRNFPERIIAIYSKPETNEYWQPIEKIKIKVNGRHWVKVV